jgi:hypothetical protein
MTAITAQIAISMILNQYEKASVLIDQTSTENSLIPSAAFGRNQTATTGRGFTF